MPFLTLPSTVFVEESSVGKNKNISNQVILRRFQCLYGVTPFVCAKVWTLLCSNLPSSSKPKHLLWALLFLKIYGCDRTNAVLSKADEKTYRKWVWIFVRLIGQLKVILWNSRLTGREESVYKVSIDGTDVPIYEPYPFDPKWYSHKFRGPGLRYEDGVGIESGCIVWVLGPYRCGSYPDVKIFRLGLKQRLLVGEKVVADGWYQDDRCSASSSASHLKYWSFVRAPHEVLNKRLKQFSILKNRFRHKRVKHSLCFFAVANLTQLLIEDGEPIFRK